MMIIIVGLLFMYLPILLILYFSLGPSGNIWIGYKQLADWDLICALVNSLLLSTLITVVAICLTLAFCLIIRKSIAYQLLIYHIMIPEIVIALSLFHLSRLFYIQPGFWCLVFAYLVVSTFYCLYLVQNALNLTDTQILEEAAQDLGASNFRIFTQITIPNIKFTIISAICVSLVIILDEVIISILLSGSKVQTLAAFIFAALKFGYTIKLNALSSAIAAFVFIILIIYNYIL